MGECRALPGLGCGYLRFSSWEAASEALSALNERAVTGWPKPLSVKWATPKSQSSGRQGSHNSSYSTHGGGGCSQASLASAGAAAGSALTSLASGHGCVAIDGI